MLRQGDSLAKISRSSIVIIPTKIKRIKLLRKKDDVIQADLAIPNLIYHKAMVQQF